MLFRPALISDIPVLLHMEQQLVEAERPFDADILPSGATYYDFNDLVQSDLACVLMIEDESGELVGTGYVQIRDSKPAHKHERHGYLGCMYVAPNQRGKGLITTLINKLTEWSKEQGVTDFYLDVYDGNNSAIRAYEKLGFKPCLVEMKLNL